MGRNYLLDTNICISLLKNKFGVRDTVLEVGAEHCFVSEITIAELYFGASKSGNKTARIRDVDFIKDNFGVMPIFSALPLYGDIKAELQSAGTPVDDFDILIGATSIVNDMVMVTDNVKHLGRIPNIILENWTHR